MQLAPNGANLRRAGFTLLEVLAVLALLAVVAGIGLGAGTRVIESGRKTRAQAELAVISAALESYRTAFGDYPRTDDSKQLLRAMRGQRGPASPVAIAGRRVLEEGRLTIEEGALLDPWQQPYRYAYKEPAAGWVNPRFVLYSSGPDRIAFSRLTSGGFLDRGAAENLDNVDAGQN